MRYEVVGESREIGGSYFEPPEYGCDFWEGEATTARRAKRKAIAQWIRDGIDEPWAQDIVVIAYGPCPEHGDDCDNGRYESVDGIMRVTGHYDLDFDDEVFIVQEGQ